jgi:TolB-like protein
VLPFANISSDPENDCFCDGISEKILNQLSRFTNRNVIGRTSSFAFKDSDVGAASINDALGVHLALQGSVRKHREQLRISAQLLDGGAVQVWAKTFDRELRNVLKIRSEIASAVATMVASEMSSARPAEHVPPVEAYEPFLAVRELLNRRVHVAAEREFRRAIEIDPQFAEAYAELGISESISMWQQSRWPPTRWDGRANRMPLSRRRSRAMPGARRPGSRWSQCSRRCTAIHGGCRCCAGSACHPSSSPTSGSTSRCRSSRPLRRRPGQPSYC